MAALLGSLFDRCEYSVGYDSQARSKRPEKAKPEAKNGLDKELVELGIAYLSENKVRLNTEPATV